MVNKSRMKYVAGLLVVVVVLGITMFVSSQMSYASEKQTISQYLSSAGAYMKDHKNYLDESLKSIGTKSVKAEDIVAEVDGLPITIGELNYRIGLRFSYGEDANINDVFNYLVGEKVVLSYAMKNKQLPTKDDITQFINQEKQSYISDPTYKDAIDMFIASADLTLDEYWNTYEYYNAFRIIAFKKAYDFAIVDAQKKGLLEKPSNGQNQNKDLYKKYWDSDKLNMIKNAAIKLNKDNYSNFSLVVNTDTLYFKSK